MEFRTFTSRLRMSRIFSSFLFDKIQNFQILFDSIRKKDEEKIHFVKYSRFEDEKELSELSVSARENDDQRTSLDGSLPDFKELDEHELIGCHTDKITEWEAGWNITNAIQGMFIVSFPYAVLQGGYWAIIAIIFVSYICCHTGKILVECLYDEDKYGNVTRVRCSYVDVANHVWGSKIGGKIVNVAQIIELLMTCILYVLLCGELIHGSFPNAGVDLSSWIMISTALLLPCAFLQSIKSVSWLSFWCTVAHMIINAVIIIFCFTKIEDWKWNDIQLKIDIWTFPISLGIVVFSYTSQIFVPTLEGNMATPQRFSCMMNWTHIAAAAFKALFALIGFLTFGMGTKEVISNNLPSQAFIIVINIIFVIKALFSYPLPYFAAVEILDETFFRGKPKTIFPQCTDSVGKLKVWGVALRLWLVIVTMLLAIFIPHFAILMGLIGSFTGTMLSFVWPCYFHLKIKWHKLRWYSKAWDIIIILLGLCCAAVGMYYSGRALVRALQGLPTDPYKTHIPIHGNVS